MKMPNDEKEEKRQKIGKYYSLLFAIGMIAAIIYLITFIVLDTPSPQPDNDTDAFAKCLAENNFTVFYTDWCGACKIQKEMFGDSWQLLNTVNLDIAGAEYPEIRAIPTWLSADNNEYRAGVLSFDELAVWSGCQFENAN